jgi:hypothetical protein
MTVLCCWTLVFFFFVSVEDDPGNVSEARWDLRLRWDGNDRSSTARVCSSLVSWAVDCLVASDLDF